MEVENCLLSHDAVSNVSVVGLPDEKYGEVVAAFVIKHSGKDLTANDVRKWVRENLSGHLGAFLALPSSLWPTANQFRVVPKYVFWVEDYPKTASGKVQKFKLREGGVQLLKEGKGME